jgi:hypothetical protein
MILRDLYQEENKFILSEVEWSQLYSFGVLRSPCRDMELLPKEVAASLWASQ